MNEAEWLASTDPEKMLQQGDRRLSLFNFSDRKLRLFACACARQGWHLLTDARSRKAVEAAEAFADGGATWDDLAAARAAARDAARAAARDAAWYAARDAAGAAARAAARDATEAAARDATEAAAGAATWAGARAKQAVILRDIIGNPFRPVVLPIYCPQCLVEGAVSPGVNWSKCLRCGNPTQCPWLTPTVLAIARGCYEDRLADGRLDPVTLGILSDALEDVGCPAEVPTGRKRIAGAFCPKCGDDGRWRSGVGFEHEKRCERCRISWEPGDEFPVFDPHPLLAHLRGEGPRYRGDWAVDLILGKE